MKKRIFECVNDEEYGDLGWREVGKGKDGFNASDARVVAHDIFEHFSDDNGEMHHEFMAQGAMHWIRYQTGAFNRLRPSFITEEAHREHVTFVYMVKGLFHQLFMEGEGKGRSLVPFPGKQRPLADEYVEEDLQATIREGIKAFRAEDLEAADNLGDEELRNFVVNAVAWIREGYRRVQRRYRGLSNDHVRALFETVVAEVSSIEMIEGKRIEIYVNPTRDIVRVEEVYEYDYA